MKKSILLVLLVTFSLSCKQKEEAKVIEKEWSTAEKIANAHGLENWKNVSELQFTFNVDRDTIHFERSWIWNPKSEDVVMISGKDTVAYNRKSIDSISLNADKSFINDKYWLLAPFQLVWDTSASISEVSAAEAPISKTQLNKITITYTNEGGYTPGDAYDFYYGDDFMLKEWVYRKGNSKEPSMMTTWEDFEDFSGIKISKTHKRPEVDWTLHFTNIKVIQ
ncbi:hypothetical protein ES711_05370 [Gelidibacter salicanalis]|uniref:Selenophosphate synthetase n=1 Tax=Gelidibacter salicanalis TaxID=291193 RepID=A0A5C7AKM7_9FLAO|nr:hypothetical protein [Gelidibacter salicanalis]TXE09360.1 hypothetical protein ES711_05370 [Gelidibacter salicanalis]